MLPPDVLVTLLRDAEITVEAQDLQGEPQRDTLQGEAARAFQHELDHLNGVLIIDHATDDADFSSKAYPKLRALEEEEHSERQAVAFERQIDGAVAKATCWILVDV